jgi:hypothetical protein
MIWWHTWRMGIFNRTVNKAAISPQPTKAAAAGGTFYQNNNAGAQLVGQYYSYVEGTARNRAMSVPTISRSRPYGQRHRLHEFKDVHRNVER